MTETLKVTVDGWENGKKIPGKFAFGVPASEGHVALSDNKNPSVSWSDAPTGTQSFAIICHDPDVPSSGEDVNQEDRLIPSELPRVDFYHWVLVDIPVSQFNIAEGEDSNGITEKGKSPGSQHYGIRGINNYTDWFAGDPDMAGNYGGYDGPCPPWNDSIVHHYHITVYALDTDSIGLSGAFGGPEALAAMEGHVLARGSIVGNYSLNPDIQA